MAKKRSTFRYFRSSGSILRVGTGSDAIVEILDTDPFVWEPTILKPSEVSGEEISKKDLTPFVELGIPID